MPESLAEIALGRFEVQATQAQRGLSRNPNKIVVENFESAIASPRRQSINRESRRQTTREEFQPGDAIICSQYSCTMNSEAGTVPATQMAAKSQRAQSSLITVLLLSILAQSRSA